MLDLKNIADNAAVLSLAGEVIEADMDDIELSIVQHHYERNKKYMGTEML